MLGIQNIGTVSVVKARNSLLGDCLEQCRQYFQDLLANRRHRLVLDLSESPIVDSEGLEFIVDAQQTLLQRGGRMVIAEPQSLCREVLEITGVSEYVAIFDDRRVALGEFTK